MVQSAKRRWLAEAELVGVGPRLGQHGGGHVDADDATGGADLARRQESVEAGAGAEVDHHLARLHGGDGLGIAATQAEIGTVAHRRQVLGAVAHAPRQFVDVGLGSAAAAG